jgi:hypothetical protein
VFSFKELPHILNSSCPPGVGQTGNDLLAVAFGVDARIEHGDHAPVGLGVDEAACW